MNNIIIYIVRQITNIWNDIFKETLIYKYIYSKINVRVKEWKVKDGLIYMWASLTSLLILKHRVVSSKLSKKPDWWGFLCQATQYIQKNVNFRLSDADTQTKRSLNHLVKS